jgi:hypothetical protein
MQLAAARKSPTRLTLGSDTVARIEKRHRDVERELDLWRSVSISQVHERCVPSECGRSAGTARIAVGIMTATRVV